MTKKKKTPAKKAKAKTPEKAVEKTQVYAHLFDSPKNVKRAIQTLFAVCAITFGLDYFVKRHVDHAWEGLFGFYAVYGFAACVILVLVAKELRKVLMRGKDYYDG